MLITISKLIACHLIGDYVLQSDYIANTKGQNWYHMFIHCFLYCVPFAVAFGFTPVLVVIFVAHLLVDPLKARWHKIAYWQDQAIHYATLAIYLL